MTIELTTQNTLSDHILARNVAEHLEKKYPGWLWGVTVDQGVVDVRSMRCSGAWGFRMLAEKIDNDYAVVTRAGGEILERFRASRTRFRDGSMDNSRRDITGMPTPDMG